MTKDTARNPAAAPTPAPEAMAAVWTPATTTATSSTAPIPAAAVLRATKTPRVTRPTRPPVVPARVPAAPASEGAARCGHRRPRRRRAVRLRYRRQQFSEQRQFPGHPANAPGGSSSRSKVSPDNSPGHPPNAPTGSTGAGTADNSDVNGRNRLAERSPKRSTARG